MHCIGINFRHLIFLLRTLSIRVIFVAFQNYASITLTSMFNIVKDCVTIVTLPPTIKPSEDQRTVPVRQGFVRISTRERRESVGAVGVIRTVRKSEPFSQLATSQSDTQFYRAATSLAILVQCYELIY